MKHQEEEEESGRMPLRLDGEESGRMPLLLDGEVSCQPEVPCQPRIPRTLIVGDIEAREFAEPVRWLEARTSLTRARTVEEAVDGPLSESAREAIIVAQGRPGEIPESAIARLHQAAPLARMVALLGSWCEGETRSGTPWPGVMRLYWHQFIDRLEREWFGEVGPASDWCLPRTATDTDRLLHATHDRPVANAMGLAVIRAAQFAAYEGLADPLNLAGWSTIWWAPHSPLQCSRARAIVWDFTSISDDDLRAFRSARRFLPTASALAIVGFPRESDVATLREAGAQCVVSKPFLMDDLLHRMARLAPPSPKVARPRPRSHMRARLTA